MAKINVRHNSDEKVICPHCQEEITEIIETNVSGGMITSKSIYSCSKCHKVIPVSHSTYAF